MRASARRVLPVVLLPALVLALTSAPVSGRQVKAPAPEGRGTLGVYIVDLLPAGILVTVVSPGGPGDRGGIKAGDVLLKANGKEVPSGAHLIDVILGATRPGETIHFTLDREGRQTELDVVLGSELPADPSERREADLRWCTISVCLMCIADVGRLDNPTNADCRACRSSQGRSVDACVRNQPRADAGQAGEAAAPAPPSSTPPPPIPVQPPPDRTLDPPVTTLVLHGVTLAPARVAPGERFVINVSYASPSGAPVSFAFTIGTGGRELFSSKTESIAGTAGARMLYSRSVAAASDPGVYQVRVSLSLDGQGTYRDTTLTVATK
jgi:hypothetical protein